MRTSNIISIIIAVSNIIAVCSSHKLPRNKLQTRVNALFTYHTMTVASGNDYTCIISEIDLSNR